MLIVCGACASAAPAPSTPIDTAAAMALTAPRRPRCNSDICDFMRLLLDVDECDTASWPGVTDQCRRQNGKCRPLLRTSVDQCEMTMLDLDELVRRVRR